MGLDSELGNWKAGEHGMFPGFLLMFGSSRSELWCLGIENEQEMDFKSRPPPRLFLVL